MIQDYIHSYHYQMETVSERDYKLFPSSSELRYFGKSSIYNFLVSVRGKPSKAYIAS